MSSHNSQITFLSLPPKARFRIYEYIFICKPQIIPDCRPAAGPSIVPSLLRTCKQIRSEASSVLYSKNDFLIAMPELDFEWLIQIGRDNIKLLNSIRIFPHAVYSTENTLFSSDKESSFWYKVLDLLARKATGLRRVYIFWDAEPSWGHCGAGRDLRFVRELAKIQGLESMVVGGCYGVHWPRYLTEKMGVPVLEKQDDQFSLQRLRRFQRGTEHLIP